MLRTIRPHAFEAAGPSTHRGHRRIGTVVWRWARLAVLVGLMLFGAAVALLAVFRFVDPPFTAFTVAQSLSGGRVTQQWVPLDGISPHLLRAVISSEDAKFCTHFGVDLGEIEAAIERARGGIPRGASTISMQVIKNLFLWQGKSYIRKAIEIPLTLVMEQLWPKTRILEVYLNIAEWGPGVYGAEAAAQFHFEKPASRLTEREAALLAVALPNPAMRDAGDPGPGTQRLADRILTRMKVVGRNISCVERSGASQRRGTAPRHAT
jgi:monofunctional biosynthetic peptidoglycan transglycosylase